MHEGTAPSLDQIRGVLRAHLPSREFRAILFGSRVGGQARRTSDWDIGVIGPHPVPGATLEYIREGLENLPTLHSFDVVDLCNVPAGFREQALASGVELI